MAKKKSQKILQTIMVVNSPTDRPTYLVMNFNRRGYSMVAYDSIPDILEDYPIKEYCIMINSVKTVKELNQIMQLW